MLYDGPGDLVKVFDGPNYGELWFDKYPIAIVAHTTETKGLPNYGGGAAAPQITIDPAKQVVYQHQPLDRRAGSLRGSSQVLRDTGVRAVMNEKAVQVEIIGYSDKATVDKYGGGRRWVGDFTDDDYAFIAAVIHYLKNLFGVGDALHARPSGKSWSAGISSPHRLGAREWEQFDGMTAHGGVFGQTHWDTGPLDLHRIWNQPPDEEDDMPKLPLFSWSRPSYEWAIQNRIYTLTSNLDAIRETEEAQRYMVFLHRYHQNMRGGLPMQLTAEQINAIQDGAVMKVGKKLVG